MLIEKARTAVSGRRVQAAIALGATLVVVAVGILVGMAARPGDASHNFAATSGAHSLAPIASSQWYSSVYHDFPTQPLYALPAAFRLTPDGLGVSLPDVHKSAQTIAAPYIADFSVGLAGALGRPRLGALGDWSVGLEQDDSHGGRIWFTLAHGVPSTVIHVAAPELVLRVPADFAAYDRGATPLAPGVAITTTDILLSTRGHAYILALDKPCRVARASATLTITGAGRLFLGALDAREHYALFKAASGAEITGTRADYAVDARGVTTTYTFATSGGEPLIALYPHQRAALSRALPALGSYATIRGTLTLVRADIFATLLSATPPAADFAPLQGAAPADLVAAVRADIAKAVGSPEPASRDYFLGTWLGDLDNLLLLAHALGLKDEQAALLRYVEPKLADALRDFRYDSALTSTLATHPEFGNEQLNDHHFHYGYYIRTAAVLSQLDPTYLPGIRDALRPLVDDIATLDPAATRFPYLRTFDAYEGHSWASGFAPFADGNNQESSSEAIQAWYALYLWGQVSGDERLRQMGLALYVTEVYATRFYWFGENGLYTPPYGHAIASLVWGGKVDFATWFSPDTNAKYGIELLPFTPGSWYLGTLPRFATYDADFRASGGSEMAAWGDLYTMWESFYAPDRAFALKDALPASAFHVPRSLFLYVLYRNHAVRASPQ